MFREELTEKGIVVDKCGSIIKVSVINAEHCDDCSAKLICNPSEKDNTIELEYDGEIKNGDQVTLAVKGKNLISLSVILYLLPLILLVAGIWGATISSAIGSILGAPRILQATSLDKITPKICFISVCVTGRENDIDQRK